MVVLPGFPATAGIVSGVVVVVVVVTERVGAGGGGAETVFHSGPEEQPASKPRTPLNARTGVSRLITCTEVERDSKVVIFVFIVPAYTPRASTTMGCYTKGNERTFSLVCEKREHMKINYGSKLLASFYEKIGCGGRI
jgi:hypothetical protein